MRTQSEIKRNNIRKANLLREAETRKNKGKVANQFGLYEQCGTPLDMEGEYMGTPRGTEPMNMMGDDDMMGMNMDMMDMDMMDDDDVMMDDGMLMMFMQEDKKAKPDFLDLDGDGDKEESMKKAAKDKKDEMDEALTGGPFGGGQTNYCCDSRECPCDDPYHPNYNDMHPMGHDFGGRVVGVDSNIEKQRMMKESYKAVSAKPSRDSWGNEYNKILTESSQVEGIKSLMKRMKK